MPPWPFKDERSFWEWAMDSFAGEFDQDADLELLDVAGLDLLITAAGMGECPKQELCRVVLDEIAQFAAWSRRADELDALRTAAQGAQHEQHPFVREWAAYVHRLLQYCEQDGPVNRATAERMGADMFAGPVAQWRYGDSHWLTVEVAGNGRLWECATPFTDRHLFINRRTGVWQVRHPDVTRAGDRG